MKCRLGVKVAALPGESVLLVNIVANILQYLAQVLTTRHRCCTFLWALSCATQTNTHLAKMTITIKTTYTLFK